MALDVGANPAVDLGPLKNLFDFWALRCIYLEDVLYHLRDALAEVTWQGLKFAREDALQQAFVRGGVERDLKSRHLIEEDA